MKKRDVFITLAVLMMAGALVAGCAGEGMMDKKKMAMKDEKMMGKKKMMKDGEAAVKARRKLMRGIGADMKRLKTAIKQGSGWVVQEQVRQAAGDMYKKASKIKKSVQEEHPGRQDDLDRRHLEEQGEVRPHRGRSGRERRRPRANPLQGRACGHQEGGGPHRQAMRRMPQVVPEEEEKIATHKRYRETPAARAAGVFLWGRHGGFFVVPNGRLNQCRDRSRPVPTKPQTLPHHTG